MVPIPPVAAVYRRKGAATRRHVAALGLALIAVLATAAAGAPARAVRAQTPHGSPPPNVLLARGRSEPAIALDPRDDRRVVAVANPDYFHLFPGEPANGTFASSNGGVTWQQGAAPLFGRFTGVADPSLGVDGTGLVYYLYMGETPAFCGESGNVALLLARSTDGGLTFGPPTVVDVNPLDDKPFIAVTSLAGHTVVYVTFSRWLHDVRQILFTRSLDGGRTFSLPTILYASAGVDFGAIPVAAPGGRLYVVWAHYQHSNYYGPLQASVMVRASLDGANSFGPAVTIAPFTGLPQMLMPGALRVFPLPTAGADARGNLYVAWVRARAMAQPQYPGQFGADLLLSRSHDGGRSWSAPLVISDSARGDRFMPALAVGNAGALQVAFYDRRTDGVHFALYGVAVQDDGDHATIWPNRRLSATYSSPYPLHYIVPGSTCVAPGRFMGDYIGATASANGDLNVAWDDTALGKPQETDLWFSRVPHTYLHAGIPRVVRWR